MPCKNYKTAMLILLLLFELSNAATEHFPRRMKLKFYFPSPEEVTFEFWVPFKTISYYDWVGIGFQDSRDPIENFQSDYYIALVDNEGVFTDRFNKKNGLPPLNEQWGGTSNLDTYRLTKDGHEIFVLTRKLITGDPFDIKITRGVSIMVKWALGHIDEHGNLLAHDPDDRGFEYVVLEETYIDKNGDERGYFGPWNLHPIDKTHKKAGKQEWNDPIEGLYATSANIKSGLRIKPRRDFKKSN